MVDLRGKARYQRDHKAHYHGFKLATRTSLVLSILDVKTSIVGGHSYANNYVTLLDVNKPIFQKHTDLYQFSEIYQNTSINFKK